MTPAIETTGLQKRYGSHPAIHDLNIAVEPGTVFGLIGPNGAGKTTTLRMLLDIIRPSSGQARVLGEDPRTGGPALRRRIGYVPGELRLEGRIRGRSLLRHYAEISDTVAPGVIGDLADRLGLDLNRQVRTMSKGNKQKLGLVQAFMHRPELLVLDEPTSGLDPLVQRTFLEMVREARTDGQTVLLSSHVLSEIQQTADHVAVLSAGRIVAEGAVASRRLGQIRRVRVSLDGGDPALARGRLASDPATAVHCFEQAVELFAASDLLLEAARARFELARALPSASRDRATTEARAALGVFDRLGASNDADVAAEQLRSSGVRGRYIPRSSARLTRREQEVLVLLADGLTNPEIATRLHISRKTAAHHVSNLLTKLGVRNRAQAIGYLNHARSGGPS